MSTPRLHLETQLAAGLEIEAEPGQAHHLGAVLRRGVGDAVAVFNARDGEWAGRITALRKDRCRILLETQSRAPAPEPDLRLMVAALKRDAMEWLVEKATELGVAAIHPVITRRSVADRVNQARLTAIARGAAEQCERLSLPVIHAAMPLHAALSAWDGTPIFMAAERSSAPALPQALAGQRLPLALLIGPEGGFDRAELDAARSCAFVKTIGLGPRILRAETAAVAGLAVLAALAGDWS
ncbi:MAG: 16S rRNA (uracil(1498)-N(3))-methyltransferase [Roseomonas sp.]|nr:16S rRNA (uracil(1498)-N(3))-methyltransferase [Roseomonas sp.]MCA3368278.1 16S rRNA (uracil(1498)-N(3))-methyltransferase [Roseomonas sp.]